ncbi:MAG: cytochrome-c peroxidase [Gemmatimonadetes bacterium]|nr:cytochrome-c peroxidase [Gemmatimonadota bacterium]
MRIVMRALGIALAGAGMVGCVDDGGARIPLGPASASADVSVNGATPDQVRQLAVARGIGPLPASPRVRPALSHLGRMLAFDKILSGNRDISCATCHLPAFGTRDGLSLSVGQGGFGLGPGRQHPGGVFIPRNAPPLFNLGAMRSLFWDGRIETAPDGAIRTPAGAAITPEMRSAFEFGPISALAMFPVTNRAEMRAAQGNELAQVPDNDPQQIWSLLMVRLGRFPSTVASLPRRIPGSRLGNSPSRMHRMRSPGSLWIGSPLPGLPGIVSSPATTRRCPVDSSRRHAPFSPSSVRSATTVPPSATGSRTTWRWRSSARGRGTDLPVAMTSGG